MRRWAAILGTALFVVAMVNFTAFFIAALALGGDALNGKAEDGHYYLRNKRKYTEVSREVWLYSRAHAISVIVTHPLGIFAGGGLLAYANRKKAAR